MTPLEFILRKTYCRIKSLGRPIVIIENEEDVSDFSKSESVNDSRLFFSQPPKSLIDTHLSED